MFKKNPTKSANHRSGGVFAGTPHSHSKRPKLLRLAASRRFVEIGYPEPAHNFTIEETERYFSGEKITCLLCGKLFHKLGGQHLLLHSVTLQEYKDRYGLPQRTGLVGRLSHERYSAATHVRIDAGEMPILGNKDIQAMAALGARKSRPRRNNKERCMKNLGLNRRKEITKDDVISVLNAMKENDSSLSVMCENLDRSAGYMRGKIREFDLESLYQDTIDSLSIETLIKSEAVTNSKTVKNIVIKKRAEGWTMSSIAEWLGTSVTTVRILVYGEAYNKQKEKDRERSKD
jgi:predicted transcriptional regulator